MAMGSRKADFKMVGAACKASLGQSNKIAVRKQYAGPTLATLLLEKVKKCLSLDWPFPSFSKWVWPLFNADCELLRLDFSG